MNPEMEFGEKMQKYVEALEEEKRKIQVFKRELPLCLELVTQAIEACKRDLSGTTVEYMLEQSECSHQTSSGGDDHHHHGLVLEEFMPIKRRSVHHHSTTCSHNHGEDDDLDDDHQEEDSSHELRNEETTGVDQRKKSEWLRSVQLWNPCSDPVKQDLPRKTVVTEVVKMNGSAGGAFQPFNKDKKSCSSDHADANNQVTGKPAAAAVSSTAKPVVNGGGTKEEKDCQRKQRRCWSPELHKRFLHALQQLGGSHVATPKQIRELMKVDGLTNDEVKSHLQKYRLHTRRPNHHQNNNNNQQPPQFVVVGGIWVPPAEYTSVTGSGETAAAATPNGIYAPVATTPSVTISKSGRSHSDNLLSEGANSRCKERGVHSNNSPATSSSTHNTSSSPAVF